MKVLIADGSPMITERLTALMLDIPSVRLLAPAVTGGAVLESVRASATDVLVMDARIASGDSRGFIAALRREKPSLVVIILSNLVDPLYRQHFESAGANLFLDKSNEFIHLRQFICELVTVRRRGRARPGKTACASELPISSCGWVSRSVSWCSVRRASWSALGLASQFPALSLGVGRQVPTPEMPQSFRRTNTDET